VEPFRKAYRVDPTRLNGLLGLVEVYFAQNEPDQAINLLASEASKSPKRADLRRELANAEVRARRYDKAIAEYQAALTQTSNNPEQQADILSRIAQAYALQGDFARGLEIVQQATALQPKNTGYAFMLAQYLDGAGKKKEAAEAYRAMLKADPKATTVLNNLAYLIADNGGDLNEALGLAQQARREDPNSAEIMDTLGWVYLKKDLVDSSVRTYEEVLQKQPDNPVYLYHYAIALARQGKIEDSVKQLNVALGKNPDKLLERALRDALVKVVAPKPK
jgi:tetratricopeptide (TPR) repeat protein